MKCKWWMPCDWSDWSKPVVGKGIDNAVLFMTGQQVYTYVMLQTKECKKCGKVKTRVI